MPKFKEKELLRCIIGIFAIQYSSTGGNALEGGRLRSLPINPSSFL